MKSRVCFHVNITIWRKCKLATIIINYTSNHELYTIEREIEDLEIIPEKIEDVHLIQKSNVTKEMKSK